MTKPLREAVILGACAAIASAQSVEIEAWGETPDGEIVQIFRLVNSAGVEARIASYGGVVVSLKVPDKAGALGDVLLGFDSLQGYLGDHPYFGALIGRYGNRIANGRFAIDDRIHSLALNDGPNHLHGGARGFDKRVWTAKPFRSAEGPGVVLRHVSRDGEEGYPGELAAEARYTLTEDAVLRIDYRASTNRATPLNLTNHAYFNLKDAGASTILDHELAVEADHYTPIDATLIPTGRVESVGGTPFDFRRSTRIGDRVDAADEQIKRGGGYDHNYVLRRATGSDLERAATVFEPTSGRVMEVWTTEPGVQFYSGNFLDGSLTGKGGARYEKRSGLCLETQHFPDSPNQPAFPSTILEPGEIYESRTEYRFSVRR